MSLWQVLFTETRSEPREFLARRLALLLGLVAILSGGFYLAGFITTLVFWPGTLWRVVTHQSNIAHVIGTLMAAGAWALVKYGNVRVRVLDATDAVATFVVCATFAFMMTGQQDNNFPEVIVTLAVSWTLVIRAALVPSPPLRTTVIGIACFIPTLVVTYLSSVEHPFGHVLYQTFWAVLAVVATTTVSHVIYGLRREVKAAMSVGQYTLIEKIGEGGMGAVYRASHMFLRRPTAVKLLPADKSGAEQIERFEREVQLASVLTHPNSIAIYDFGRTPEGVFYYAMEYVEGVTLEELVRVDGPLPSGRVIEILRQCCAALNEAHVAGLVHRDIKPANIMLTARGGMYDVVKVLDYGLVKDIGNNKDDTTGGAETGSGHIIGTPHYMAPEAITNPKSVDARTDLYALGATGYFLLTGMTVFDAESLVEACSKHMFEEPVAPSVRAGIEIPSALELTIMQCLAKEPGDRPASARGLRMKLDTEDSGWSEESARDWWTAKASSIAKAAAARRKRLAASETTEGSMVVDIGSRAD